MGSHNSLYGRSIVPGIRVTQVEQLHDILCEEIQSGRWKVGDRLPSVSDLVEMSGLSRGSVQRAMGTLREEGYIYQEKRKGTFLSSLLPYGDKAARTIGIAMMKTDETPSQEANRPFVFQLHWILDMAAKQGCLTRVLYLDKNDDWTKIDRVDGPFGSDVKGILTPYPFHHPEFEDLPADRIPTVFVGPHTIDSLPFACGDTWHGTYYLTKKVIAAGHSRIIACTRPNESELEQEAFLKGYRLAMTESGLHIDESSIERSAVMPVGDLPALRSYLDDFKEATAIVSSWYQRSRDIVSVCDMLGVRVPEELSVVNRDTYPMRLQDADKIFTCFQYNTRQAVAAAFEMLLQLIEHGRCRFSRAMIPTTLIDGHSLGRPRNSGAVSMRVVKARPAPLNVQS